jgi:hypothetical protein
MASGANEQDGIQLQGTYIALLILKRNSVNMSILQLANAV